MVFSRLAKLILVNGKALLMQLGLIVAHVGVLWSISDFEACNIGFVFVRDITNYGSHHLAGLYVPHLTPLGNGQLRLASSALLHLMLAPHFLLFQ